MPSPIRLICRCTRKKPTGGASTPTIAPGRERQPHELEVKHASATGRATRPGARTGGRRRRSAAHEHEPLDDVLDRAELVRDVDDRDAELAVRLLEQHGEGLPATRRRRRSVARRARAATGCAARAFAMEAPLLLPPESRLRGRDASGARPTRSIASATASRSSRGSRRAAERRRPASTTSRTVAGASTPIARALREVADPRRSRNDAAARRRAARVPRVGRSSPSASAQQRRLAAAVRPAIATNSPSVTRRSTPADGLRRAVGEVDAVELDR
jgi:hypothetical protein